MKWNKLNETVARCLGGSIYPQRYWVEVSCVQLQLQQHSNDGYYMFPFTHIHAHFTFFFLFSFPSKKIQNSYNRQCIYQTQNSITPFQP